MTARLPQDQVDLLQGAADFIHRWDNVYDRNVEAILRWVADPESAGPVLHQSALAIARAVLGETEPTVPVNGLSGTGSAETGVSE